MAYPYEQKTTSYRPGEVIVFDKTVSCSKTASGVRNNIVDLPPGAFKIGLSISTNAATAAAALKVYPYQNVSQDTDVDALGLVMKMMPHSATALTTVITAPAAATYSGSSGELMTSNTSFSLTEYSFPYGIMVQTTCNTDVGTVTYRVTATRV